MKIYEFVNRSRNSLGVSEAAIHKKSIYKDSSSKPRTEPKAMVEGPLSLRAMKSSFVFHLSFHWKIFIAYSLWLHINTLLFWTHFSVFLLFFFPSLSFFSLNPAQSPSKSCHHNDINRVPALDHCANLNLPISSFFIVMNILWGQKTWFRSSSVSSYLILDKLLSCVSVSSFFNVG